ncbi:MAG TPA: CoA transferase [Methylomirabilota bacterium]|jgi:formyl-CoA transferase|nr:CoA transferase [Methylomirabilota bacterium]
MAIPRQSFEPEREGPLRGVRVLDFSRLVAGNMLSLQLADFGAEVVKVESPGRGDTLRDWREAGMSVHWKVYARNKKSISLDLKAPEAPAIILDLVPHFEVMIESFRYRYLERLGVGPDALLERNPKLVLVRVSGFGQTGPYAKRPGFGTLVEAMSGFASRNGFEDREPVLPPLAMADMIAGLSGAMATVIAVRNVEVNGGRGQVIDLSLLESIFSILGPEAAIHKLSHKIRRRVGSASEGTSPRNVYATSDGGWVAISASTQAMTERLFRAIGRDDLNHDPAFKTNTERVKRREEVDAIVGGFIKQRTLADAIRFFEEAEVTAGPVYDIGQFLEDPHVQARGIVVETPDEEMGEVPMHAVVPRLSGTPGPLRYPAPAVGQHNREIFSRIGYSEDRIDSLAQKGII